MRYVNKKIIIGLIVGLCLGLSVGCSNTFSNSNKKVKAIDSNEYTEFVHIGGNVVGFIIFYFIVEYILFCEEEYVRKKCKRRKRSVELVICDGYLDSNKKLYFTGYCGCPECGMKLIDVKDYANDNCINHCPNCNVSLDWEKIKNYHIEKVGDKNDKF